MTRARLCIAVMLLGPMSWAETTGRAAAQSSNTVAAEQSCLNAAKQGDNAGSVSACTQALTLDPHNATAALILCAAYTGLANYGTAITSCSQAITLNAKAEGAYLNRCDAYLNLGNLTSAAADCTQAMTLNPKDANVYINLGSISAKQDNFADAITKYNQAIALAPNSAMAIANRGLANVALGNKDAALTDFRSALKIDPSNQPAQKGMALLGTASGTASEISICNDFSVRIYVAFAYQAQGGFTAAGWWGADPNKCEPADFSFPGATLYYTADSDEYKNGSDTVHEHWGNDTDLNVISEKFNFDNAQQKRGGTRSEKFSSIELTPQQQGKPVVITFHFSPGHTATDVVIKKQ
ncbi:MAG: tetratricopeptide repeat protein [Xanthobacteraceae bacterium]